MRVQACMGPNTLGSSGQRTWKLRSVKGRDSACLPAMAFLRLGAACRHPCWPQAVSQLLQQEALSVRSLLQPL